MTVALHSNGVCSRGPPPETPLPTSLLRGHTLTGKEGKRAGGDERNMQKERNTGGMEEGWKSLIGRLLAQRGLPGTFILVSASSCAPGTLMTGEMEGWRKRSAEERERKVPSCSSLVAMVAGCAGMCLSWQCLYLWHEGTWGNQCVCA